ncbi:MAG TPA: FAD-binding oxidoreductase [Gemmatimonadales bacterium]
MGTQQMSLAAAVRSTFRGTLIAPGDPTYDEARRVWNGTVDRHPALIARCRDAEDVVRVVELARENGLPVAVRGGGHNVAGDAVCDGGLVVDLSAMRSITVDPQRRLVRAEGGALWGELDRATQGHGLATTGGIVSTTGVAGLTLGGGIGWLARSYGLACDNLVSVNLVTADGRQRTVSAEENPDLFWAVRGCGGNFGVATSLDFRLHTVGPVLGGLLVHPFAAARDLLRLYRDVVEGAPPELAIYAVLTTSPAGDPAGVIAACYNGSPGAGELALRRLRTYGGPLADGIETTSYTAVQTMLDAFYPRGLLNYWKSSFLTELPDAAIDSLLRCTEQRPTPMCHLAIEQLGGAIRGMGPDETAFAHRDMPYCFLCLGVCTDPAEYDACVRWVRSTWEAMQPYAAGVYVNYLGTVADEGSERVHAAYAHGHYERLAALKAQYDPGNMFRVNQNIEPAAATTPSP